MKTAFSFTFVLAFAQHCFGATHEGRPNLGTFQQPSAYARPRFRYWVPDASVNLSTIRQDIEDAGKIGAGGVELLGYYNYGDIESGAGVIPVDWAKYGWGTPAWRDLQDAALQATKDNNLVIDLALGPNQGAGVPAPVDADRLQWDLQPFNVSIPVGGSFDNTLPGWGTGPLVSASTGLVRRSANISSVMTYTLSAESLHDVTDQVAPDGQLALDFTADGTGEQYVIFAYYLVHTQYREQQTPELVVSGKGVEQSPVTSFVQNGSWVVDHFSRKGAEEMSTFWKTHLLEGGHTSELVRQVGRYMWEDSQEFKANILWTPNVPVAFKVQHGYPIGKYIPLLMHDNSGGISLFGSTATSVFVTDEADSGASHVVDFRQTMTLLNQDYLNGLTEFANSIGMQSSAQVAYNFPLDMLSNVPRVDAPECETLGFSHTIDSYRQFAGPANLAGKRVISSEAGATPLDAFQQTVHELLWQLKRSTVGGVNAFILHGMPYSGFYPNTTWPTYTTFTYIFSEMHNRHQPGWQYYRAFMDYTARSQQIAQSGVPKADVAFWQKKTSYTTVPRSYQPTDLEQAGYTYEYLSPDDFSLPGAYVEGGILAPQQQAFKALIVRSNETLTAFGVSKLEEWAKDGLPIIFSGGVPVNVSGTVSAGDHQRINASLARITKLRNVHVVPAAGLAQSLSSLGIRPRVSLSGSNDIWYTRWWESAEETTVFIYWDTLAASPPTSNKTVKFAANSTPWVYDAWTGVQNPAKGYSQSGNTTTMVLTLAGNQTAIIAFKKHDSRRLTGEHAATGVREVDLSRNWTLTVESWMPPDDIFDIEGTVKENSTYSIDRLLPWNRLSVGTNLTFVSGRGFYQSTFVWPLLAGESIANEAVISMSPIIHTAVLYVNGRETPPLDVTAPEVDISGYLQKGVNTIDIVVSTPLGNAMIPVIDKLKTMGASAVSLPEDMASLFGGAALIQPKEYGLVGDVVLKVRKRD
ncbi:hypothetical protein M409DRAFT_20615 [Zasmidium cellare ATCC 36951]|uniref:Glycoside hydrolase family 2 protein n=1 Tax=Zasmidium cellare ATCC 36951 TaxID=1080233 RepID=A0A6A6CQN0_ZASCE|nr:uncharacterized protein M409DRAFT_20615 [Zasmidium cellare ATCC 36951]KAF2169395.1 hypothetical protein M409DRAFT_20615 [Zasmidium cellare ATCC 36951]